VSHVTTPRPGEIYRAYVPGEDLHRVIIVSAQQFNRGGYATVVLATSQRFDHRRSLPNCVPFRAGECGFDENCVAQCENIFTIDVSDLRLETGPLGFLTGAKLRDVIRAIGYVIEADCEPAPRTAF
jgi:mRNA-degrading endonuclease toxin of MazEF toxin-antitoxin module